MPIKISVRPQFQKDLKNLAPKEQKALQEAINNFRNNSGPFDITRIRKTLWRLKVGEWRAFFEFQGDIVLFLNIERRGSKTYKKR